MEIVVLVAKEYGISPFDVLNSDVDDFARLVNFLVEAGRETSKGMKKKTDERIRVNDKTATGGWW